ERTDRAPAANNNAQARPGARSAAAARSAKTAAPGAAAKSGAASKRAADPRREGHRGTLIIPDTISVKGFADKLGVPATAIIKTLMGAGVMAAINQSIDH